MRKIHTESRAGNIRNRRHLVMNQQINAQKVSKAKPDGSSLAASKQHKSKFLETLVHAMGLSRLFRRKM